MSDIVSVSSPRIMHCALNSNIDHTGAHEVITFIIPLNAGVLRHGSEIRHHLPVYSTDAILDYSELNCAAVSHSTTGNASSYNLPLIIGTRPHVSSRVPTIHLAPSYKRRGAPSHRAPHPRRRVRAR